MKKLIFSLSLLLGFVTLSLSQTNISVSSQEMENVLKGNYDPKDYKIPFAENSKANIIQGIEARISADTIKKFIEELNQFRTRHSASDTLSTESGIGAARRWAYSRLMEISTRRGGGWTQRKSLVAYLDFDVDICGVTKHRNVLAVVPGTRDSMNDCILIEAHIDSRCESRCDTACVAKGIEDNASGVALVMEMYRLVAQLSLERTVVFMLTTGEEQGLHGGRAFAKYAKQEGIEIRAVQNNDVIGGIICGKTASPPGCPGEGLIDSTQVRIFSAGAFNSANKQYARFAKLQYEEELKPAAKVPMQITIMSAEDRTGRGGDHIPFREEGFTAVRFTSAHEHGNGHIGTEYTDRQHTEDDILGEDTNSDGKIDQYFVDFNYLARNTQINALAACMAAIGPPTPDFTLTRKYGTILQVRIDDPNRYLHYRIALHTSGHDWDSIITLKGGRDLDITVEPNKFYFVSVANVDSEGVESVFTGEKNVRTNSTNETPSKSPVVLLDNRPNPFDFATTIVFELENVNPNDQAHIEVMDLEGKLVKKLDLELKSGLNEVLYKHGYGVVGHFTYTLFINGKALASKTMIFAN